MLGSSRSEVFCKKVTLKSFTKFTKFHKIAFAVFFADSLQTSKIDYIMFNVSKLLQNAKCKKILQIKKHVMCQDHKVKINKKNSNNIR